MKNLENKVTKGKTINLHDKWGGIKIKTEASQEHVGDCSEAERGSEKYHQSCCRNDIVVTADEARFQLRLRLM